MTSVDDQPVMKTRQKSAFPPNFVHSLDSTHMMLAALRSRYRGAIIEALGPLDGKNGPGPMHGQTGLVCPQLEKEPPHPLSLMG